MPHERCPTTHKECLTASVAQATAKRIHARAYRCPDCRAWHTHTPTPLRRSVFKQIKRQRALRRAERLDRTQDED